MKSIITTGEFTIILQASLMLKEFWKFCQRNIAFHIILNMWRQTSLQLTQSVDQEVRGFEEFFMNFHFHIFMWILLYIIRTNFMEEIENKNQFLLDSTKSIESQMSHLEYFSSRFYKSRQKQFVPIEFIMYHCEEASKNYRMNNHLTHNLNLILGSWRALL